MVSLDVIGFGSLCVDFTFKVKSYPRKGSTNLSVVSFVGCGGIIGNFLLAVLGLGLSVVLSVLLVGITMEVW